MGWKTILGFEVYVQDGYITRGILRNFNGDTRTAYVYRKSKISNHSCYQTITWDREDKISVNAFRAGVNRGTITLM